MMFTLEEIQALKLFIFLISTISSLCLLLGLFLFESGTAFKVQVIK